MRTYIFRYIVRFPVCTAHERWFNRHFLHACAYFWPRIVIVNNAANRFFCSSSPFYNAFALHTLFLIDNLSSAQGDTSATPYKMHKIVIWQHSNHTVVIECDSFATHALVWKRNILLVMLNNLKGNITSIFLVVEMQKKRCKKMNSSHCLQWNEKLFRITK